MRGDQFGEFARRYLGGGEKCGLCLIIGTLSSDNGDVHENFAENRLRILSLFFRDCPYEPSYLKEGNLGWS